MKRILRGTLALAMVFSSFVGTRVRVDAAGGAAQISITDEKASIGNEYLRREFSIKDGKILTSAVINNRINKTLNPQTGSEDFVINTLASGQIEDEEDVIVNEPSYTYTQPLSTKGWSATLKNSAGTTFAEMEVAKLFDHNLSTNVDNYQISGHPFTLDINLGEMKTLAAMSVNKRPGYFDSAYGINGTMGGYEIWTSENGTDYTKVTEGTFTEKDYNLHQVQDLYNVGDMVYVNFDTPITTQYIRVVQTSVAFGTAQEFTSAEVDFYDKPVEKVRKVIAPEKVLDRTKWKASIKNAAGTTFADAHVAKVFDGDLNTHPDEYTKSGHPITMDIDLGEEKTVRSFSVDKRPGFYDANYGTNGTMGEFELYVSKDGKKWNIAGAGNFTKEAYNLHSNAEGTLHNIGDRVYANFYKPYTTRYVRLVQKGVAFGTAQEFTTSEFNLYEDQYIGANWNIPINPVSENAIVSSGLALDTISEEAIEGGKGMRISYAPYVMNGVTWTIDMVVVMEDSKHYMNSYLDIKVDKPEEAKVDYIDYDAFVLPFDAEGVWSIPSEADTSSMWIGRHELMLGQPIYAEGMFFGSEFPAQESDVIDDSNTMKMRYYSGKTFAKMAEDHQLQKDGTLRTWNNVIGAAQGSDTSVVQTDFFEYIEDVATPTNFRKQYNSWYDNMMNITDESIADSFNGSEKGLAENGVEPLDSYVVDDGWNNYYDGTFTGPGSSQGSGTPNQTGFWEFNNKFPNELYTSSALVDKFNSTFGVWVGPQGGYNFFGSFADFLESKGTGEVQNDYWKNICTGSRLYLNNFEKMAIDYQNRFNVEYWKWDGFAVRPCTNANHHHMAGGDKNMYYTSDMWEAWTDLFENVRANNPNIFINATCYVNLSPWLLQWVNTIWVQDSGDTGQAGDTTAARHQQKIYYRDNVYYNLYKKNQIQFPLKNIYNHDPIYGVSDGSNATTEVFREFLMDNAMRGTAFWELYYSPSIMNEEKWMVTADGLAFAESNHDVLKNAKLFVTKGGNPTNSVYGYSAWSKDKGFVSFVNPTATEKTYTLTLNDVNGVPQGMADLVKAQVYPYTAALDETTVSYGEELTVTLAPFSSQIYQFGVKDKTAPVMVSAKITDTDTVRVKFNERINVEEAAFTINGAETKGTLLADYRTVEFTVSDLTNETEVNIAGLKDVYGNEADVMTVTARANEITSANSKDDLDDEVKEYAIGEKTMLALDGKAFTLTDDGVAGTTDFGISMAVNTKAANAVLMSQENGFTLRIDKEGYVVFDVKGTQITSKEEVTTVVEKAHGTFGTEAYVPTSIETTTIGKVNDGVTHTINAVREPNGMIKLYVDGRLAASKYDKAKLNENIAKGSIVLGSKEYTGYVSDVKVENNAVYYDEAKVYYDSYGLEKDLIEVDRIDWSATACSQQTDQVGTGNDGSAMDILDGKNNTYWHSNWSGGDTCTKPHWLKVNFNKLTDFDVLEYVARPGASNGTWQNVTVLGINEDGSETVIAENEAVTLTNNAYRFVFDETQSYVGVKFVLNTTIGGFGSAAEVKAFTNPIEMASKVDVESLQQKAQELLDSVNEEEYTFESYNAFKDAVEMIFKANPFNTTVSELIVLENTLEETYKALERKEPVDPEGVDKKALQSWVDKVNGLNEREYIASTWNALIVVLENAQSVLNDADATQIEVDNACKQLIVAYLNLRFIPNKALLEDLINKYETLKETDYKKASWQIFEKAYEEALVVFADQEATQTEVDVAYNALNNAYAGLTKPGAEIGKDSEGTDTGDTSNVAGLLELMMLVGAVIVIRRKTSK